MSDATAGISSLDGGAGAAGRADLGPRSLTSAVYERLRQEILTCRLRPDERLKVMKLKERFNVSASAIREALSRLLADGLVIAEDQLGFRVSRVSREDLRDITQTRIEIECIVLRRAIERGDAAWEKGIRTAAKELFRSTPVGPNTALESNEEYAEAHRRFHSALIASCGSAWTLRFRSALYEQSERYRMLSSVMSPSPDRDVNGEHHAMMDAVLDRDADTACRLLTAHLQETADRVEEALISSPETTSSG